nr:cytochrome P450 [Agasicles hygrophila]
MSQPTLISDTGEPESAWYGNTVLIFLLGITTLLTLYEYWCQNQRHVKLAKDIPSIKRLPIVGNAHLVLGKSAAGIFRLATDLSKTIQADVAKVFLGNRLIVAIYNAEDAETILGSSVHLQKSPDYSLFEPWLGDGLLISYGEKWKSHRKMIAPTFHATILKSFIPTFNKNTNRILEKLKEEKGKIFDCHDYMSTATVDTLLETAMGVEKTNEDNTGFDYAMAVMKMCNIVHLRHTKFWLRPDLFFNLTSMSKIQVKLLDTIHTLTNTVIKRKKKNYTERLLKGEDSLYTEVMKSSEYNESKGGAVDSSSIKYIRDDLDENDENDVGEKKRLAFLDFLIEANETQGGLLSDKEVSEEVNTIMFEGHDTTAAASSFFLCLLGIHTDVQRKVYEELKEIFEGNMDRPITFNDTLKMKYLERVLLETLRMYPPVPLIARQVNEDVKLATENYVIPKGTTVIVTQYLIHRNEKYWKNPTVFDPDNFLPENCQKRPYYAYIPFSAGPRSCVGRKYAMLKLKILLAGIVRKFEIISLEKEEDFNLQGDIILKREEGFKIKLSERV